MKFPSRFALCLSVVLAAASAAQAQTPPASDAPASPAVTAANSALENSMPSVTNGRASDDDTNYLYEHPTVEKFSQMYWTLGKLDLKKDEDIDNFLLINECDIYKDYYHNEFEWRTIREAARKFLEINSHMFPLRYELIEPMKLGKYDLDKHQFEVVQDYKIDGARRFEIMASNADSSICGVTRYIDRYPRALIVELSRPVVLGVIPVEPDIAQQYIEDKMQGFIGLSANKQTEQNLYQYRDAYLVMKVKFFAYKSEERNREGLQLADMMAILEGIEVYADPKKKQLLYAEDYGRKRKEHRGFKDKLNSTATVPNPNPNIVAAPDADGDGQPDAVPASDADKGNGQPYTPGKISIPSYDPGDSESEQ